MVVECRLQNDVADPPGADSICWRRIIVGWTLLAGSRLHTSRTRYLPAISNAKRILLLGEGHGRFLCEVVETCADAEIVCLDSSRKMLSEARKVLGVNVENHSVTFLETDALRHEFPHEYYDAVATHFFLDCFRGDQLAKLVPRIAGALVPGGAWLLADFCLPAHGPRRWRAALNLKVMYHFFRAVTALPASCLTQPDPYLADNGLALIQRECIDWDFIHTDLWRKITANA
jgi:SAM-dependent methyltransferase